MLVHVRFNRPIKRLIAGGVFLRRWTD